MSESDAAVMATTVTWLRLASGCECLPPGLGETISEFADVLENAAGKDKHAAA